MTWPRGYELWAMHNTAIPEGPRCPTSPGVGAGNQKQPHCSISADNPRYRADAEVSLQPSHEDSGETRVAFK